MLLDCTKLLTVKLLHLHDFLHVSAWFWVCRLRDLVLYLLSLPDPDSDISEPARSGRTCKMLTFADSLFLNARKPVQRLNYSGSLVEAATAATSTRCRTSTAISAQRTS